MSWNNLKNANVLYVNQKLTIKNSGQTKNNTSSQNTKKTHKVVSGDTLSGLAVKYNTTVRAIKTKNNLKSDLILIDQILSI